MKLTFLGTRGEIDAKSRRHRMHSSLLVEYRRRRVMIDAGEDWLGKLDEVNPHAILITHGHPDHCFGLKEGAPCPVWIPDAASDHTAHFPLDSKRRMPERTPQVIEGIEFEAFPVEHSVRAPAVGYRVTAGRVTIFYAPDVIYIHQPEKALEGCRLYIGDGATVSSALVRRQGQRLVGHTPVTTQMAWCAKNGVPKAVFTHCGTGIVDGDERKIAAELRNEARDRGIDAEIARDGMEIVLR